ncbi:phage head closure protein [Paraliobacillus sediminis]|uniref:phage head closure protein n=1 Tax=Paraliobacillus sediminis TaxID=1885916 RepID=UPI0013C2C727|nr:phage head closure protein [Paraliobacillus sediminis]
MIAVTQRYTTTSDGMGGEIYDYTNYLTIDGTLDKLSGDEVLASEKIGQISTHVFIIFEILDVKVTDRMIINEGIYAIKDVDNPNNLNRQLEITLEYKGDQVG